MVNNLEKFFKNKKIIITGHTGFKGSWLTLWLLKYNSKIVGISLKESKKNLFYKSLEIEKKIKNYYFDINLNLSLLKKIIKLEKPDFIFNLAAQAIVSKSYYDPIYTLKNNIGININLFEALREYNRTCSIVLVTSDKVYENLEIKKSYKENDLLGGKDIYSSSKSSSELIFRAYFQTFLKYKKNLNFGIARAGNVIGGGDWSANRLVPDTYKSWNRKKVLKIRNPNATRPWEFVLEPLYGYMILSIKILKNKSLNAEAFNFSCTSTNNLSVINMVKNLSKFRKKNFSSYKIDIKAKFKESKILNLNSNKAKKILRWSSILSLQQVVQFVSNWYEVKKNKKQIQNISINQINKYIDLIKKKNVKKKY